jgi:hypothetical protein
VEKKRKFWEIPTICFFDLVLQMSANGASGQELQIAPKNRIYTLFFLIKKGENYGLITSYFYPIFIAILHEMY